MTPPSDVYLVRVWTAGVADEQLYGRRTDTGNVFTATLKTRVIGVVHACLLPTIGNISEIFCGNRINI